MSLPTNLQTISDASLGLLDAKCERILKREIDRICAADMRFARVLREALAVEDEIDRRKELPA